MRSHRRTVGFKIGLHSSLWLGCIGKKERVEAKQKDSERNQKKGGDRRSDVAVATYCVNYGVLRGHLLFCLAWFVCVCVYARMIRCVLC